VIIFDSIQFLLKKINQTKFKKKLKPVQTDRFRFGLVCFLGQKPVWLGFLPVWLGFFSSFFQFGFGSVWFFWF